MILWGMFFPGNYMFFPVYIFNIVCYYWIMKLMKILLVVITIFSFLVIGYVFYLYIIAR
jgi:hypothetical protein